jgi:hypothetical protein
MVVRASKLEGVNLVFLEKKKSVQKLKEMLRSWIEIGS